MFVDKLNLYFLALLKPSSYFDKEDRLSVSESISLAWLFNVLGAILKVVLINLVVFSISYFISSSHLLDDFFGTKKYFGYFFFILSIVLDVIFFPLFAMFLMQFWIFIIKSFGSFIGVVDDVEQKSIDIVSAAMSSHIFCAIPVFGKMMQGFSGLVLLFIGLKNEMKFTTSLSICVLLSPIFAIISIVTLFLFLFLIQNL
ncbi:MAG: hypothetical protein N4A33_04110 [Bacteriovoracaceae bacterium]|jgi:hypothetical protein|nr:hypothetical protein [Bacteriovoracaceae bacterium]